MPENILKGVFKDGPLVASVIQKDDLAKIMLKGAECMRPQDSDFAATLKRVADGCRPHIEKFAERELCAVLVANPAGAEYAEFGPEEMQGFGLTKISAMDGTCGIVTRVCDGEPLPTPLAYGSLAGGGAMSNQPGLVSIPANLPRKLHKDLTPPQKKVFEVAAQVAGRGLIRLVCFEDGDLKMAVTVKDFPPPRGRSVLVPMAILAGDVDNGLPLEEIVRRLSALRT